MIVIINTWSCEVLVLPRHYMVVVVGPINFN
jgi:hypothetical protein